MTTEYYQIPSQQGFLPMTSSEDSADPWLAAATSSLSISAEWGPASKQPAVNSPPSLFEPGDAEAAVSWKNVVPMQFTVKEVLKQTPTAPKRFNSTTSKTDAWSVVDNLTTKPKTNKPAKQPKQVKQPKQKQQEELKPIEDELSQQNRYKTELCKTFNETGVCRYGTKCQFAHGKEEIRSLLRHPKYKTETCKTFQTTGTCPYGMRCRFIHTRSKIVVEEEEEDEEEDSDDDTDVTIKAPPGIPVPQWSKSWSMPTGAASQSKSARRASATTIAAPEPAF